MNWFKISASHLSEKRLSSFLSVVLMSFGVGIILILLIMSAQVEETFQKNIRGVDMVVGAKGSPLQIILSSVYHMDAPTGNISCEEAKRIAENNLVETAIPLAYGDSYKGHRIIGTTTEYLELYEGEISKGRLWSEPFEVVLGANVASNLNISIGDKIIGNHGLSQDAIEKHDEHAYVVIGILEANYSVLDQLVLTSINSVWNVHNHEEESHSDHEGHHHEHVIMKMSDLSDEQEITAMLLKFKSPMATFSLPRKVNTQTQMQAALPAIEVNRLIGLLGIGINTLKIIAILIMILSGASVFISLLSNLKDKKYELALLRSFGASRFKLFQVILQEGLMLTMTGYFFGIIISRVAFLIIADSTGQKMIFDEHIFTLTSFDGLLLLISIGVGVLSSIIPAVRAYQLNISETLSHD